MLPDSRSGSLRPRNPRRPGSVHCCRFEHLHTRSSRYGWRCLACLSSPIRQRSIGAHRERYLPVCPPRPRCQVDMAIDRKSCPAISGWMSTSSLDPCYQRPPAPDIKGKIRFTYTPCPVLVPHLHEFAELGLAGVSTTNSVFLFVY